MHDLQAELATISTEIRWIKIVGAFIVAALGGIYWQLLSLSATVETLAQAIK